jgi:hypothetical protein
VVSGWRPKFMRNIDLPRRDLSLGVAGNALVDSKIGNSGGFVFDGSVMHGTFWASAGLGAGFGKSNQFHAYVEAGIWAIVNLGVGWGAVIERNLPYSLDAQGVRHPFCPACGPSTGPQLFVGLPIGRRFFVEPYYRVHFLVFGRESILHEVGLLFKFTSWRGMQ